MTRTLIGIALVASAWSLPCPASVAAAQPPGTTPAVHANATFPRAPVQRNIRAMRPWIEALFAPGGATSATLERLVASVRATRLLVHVDEPAVPSAVWDGRLRFVSVAGGWTYVRVELRRLPARTAKAVLAHELQHALEVVDARVRSQADFDALFQRIGFEFARDGRLFYDTEAAVTAGVATLHELTGAHARLAPQTAAALRAGQQRVMQR